MGDQYTTEEWCIFAEKLAVMILNEMSTAQGEFLAQKYPKLVIMYEFFRLIRGEAFESVRPGDLGDRQRAIYDLEDEISKKLQTLRESLNSRDDRTKFYVEGAKKMFDI